MKYSSEVFDQLIQECTAAAAGGELATKMDAEIKDLRDCLNASKSYGTVVDIFIKDKENTSVEVRAMLAEIVVTGIHIGSMYQRAMEAEEVKKRVEGKLHDMFEPKSEKKEEEDVA